MKTPGADLCGAEYRAGAFPPGKEVAGGVVQVLGYRDNFQREIGNLRGPDETFQAYNPRCYVIAGRAGALLDEKAKRSFELFRNAQAGSK